jgi:glycosyltransferase involved in cell wall biosynthesis
MTPRLTIGIPTHDRPEMLRRAIGSAMAQTVPCEIVVIHDGPDEDATRLAIRQAAGDHPTFTKGVLYRHREAIGLWANWDAAARDCDTEFFLWLQDDDVLRPTVASRVAAAFDRFPEADTWIAQNKLALDGRHIWWNNGNGPWVPLEADGGIDEWECQVFRPTSYFLSWSLSPAVAFRCGPNFTDSLDAMPADCAIFAERLILAGMRGKFVADPMVAGLWIQHKDNEHRKLHDDQPRQSRILIDRLDRLMDATPDWPEILDLWARLQHPQWVVGWMGDLDHVQREGGPSRHGQAIREVLFKSLEGRVKFVPRYRWWRRAIDRIVGRAAL